MRPKTQFRSFRLPVVVDKSIQTEAKRRGSDMTEVIVTLLVEAIRDGRLPTPSSKPDRHQLALL